MNDLSISEISCRIQSPWVLASCNSQSCLASVTWITIGVNMRICVDICVEAGACFQEPVIPLTKIDWSCFYMFLVWLTPIFIVGRLFADTSDTIGLNIKESLLDSNNSRLLTCFANCHCELLTTNLALLSSSCPSSQIGDKTIQLLNLNMTLIPQKPSHPNST